MIETVGLFAEPTEKERGCHGPFFLRGGGIK